MEKMKNGKNGLYYLLKEVLEKVAGSENLDFYAESTKDVDAKFYLNHGEKNFYNSVKPKHKLHGYYNSVASSAAFAFNILGEDEKNFGKGNVINYLNEEFVVKEYEKELKPLNNRESAHLDCFIASRNKDVYIETKLTEWLYAPKNLAEAYLERDGYRNVDIYEHFSKFFMDFIDDPVMKDSEDRIRSTFTRYDAIQMFIHSLGIFNKYTGKNKKVELWNIVWDIDSINVKNKCELINQYINMYTEESEEAKEFIDYANKFIVPYFKNNAIDFEIKYIPFSEFYKNVKYENVTDRKEYLKRYRLSSM